MTVSVLTEMRTKYGKNDDTNVSNQDKQPKKKNSGFLKGVAVGMMSAVLMIAVLAGCSGLSSLIGPGSDSSVKKNTENVSEDSTGKSDDTDSGSKSDSKNDNKKATYGEYTPVSEQLTDEVIEKIDTLIQVIDYYYLYDYDKDAMIDAVYKAVMVRLATLILYITLRMNMHHFLKARPEHIVESVLLCSRIYRQEL